MKAKPILLIHHLHGNIAKGFYARMLNGKQIIQRCPIRTKPPTPAQLQARKEFVRKYATPKNNNH